MSSTGTSATVLGGHPWMRGTVNALDQTTERAHLHKTEAQGMGPGSMSMALAALPPCRGGGRQRGRGRGCLALVMWLAACAALTTGMHAHRLLAALHIARGVTRLGAAACLPKSPKAVHAPNMHETARCSRCQVTRGGAPNTHVSTAAHHTQASLTS